MQFYRILALIITAAAFLVGSAASAQARQPAEGNPGRVGRVEFPSSCEPSVQKQLERALALLHSFWYATAEKEFAAVARKDPACGMAQWGIAMSLYHPLWEPPSAEVLRRGQAAVEKGKAAGIQTPREQDYLF